MAQSLTKHFSWFFRSVLFQKMAYEVDNTLRASPKADVTVFMNKMLAI